MVNSNIDSYLRLLPHKPGIYIFRDKRDRVIYIGKASNLHSRVRSYFKQTTSLSEKTLQLVEQVDKIEFVITESEIAALVLECQQIKKYRPYFNVMLKDDKSYPYIKVDIKNDWPTISITRRRLNDGAKYIGRIPSAWSARQTYEHIRKLFPLRSCNKIINGNEKTPCLKYHIKRCLGPCIGAISREDYRNLVKQAVEFFEGKGDVIIRELKRDMQVAAQQMQFERAAQLRNKIQAIEAVISSNRIAFNINGEQDVIAIARDNDDLACILVFSVKDARLIRDDHFIIERALGENDTQLLESFLKQYYSSSVNIPHHIYVQFPIKEHKLFAEWLSACKKARVTISVPTRGTRLRLMQLVEENARQQLDIYKSHYCKYPETPATLAGLKNILGLPKLPRRIEAYDISNTQGTTSVGSMVVFENGAPKPAGYRRFKIKLAQQPDDYAMMREIIFRRFSAYNQYPEKWPLPDLMLIDGGKGHLNAAVNAMHATSAECIPIISIAKENEDVFQVNEAKPVAIEKASSELHLLQRIRDESHRFAITYHKYLRSRKSRESALDSIPGIGPNRKKALITNFGSVSNLKGANIADIAAVRGITHNLAKRILDHLA